MGPQMGLWGSLVACWYDPGHQRAGCCCGRSWLACPLQDRGSDAWDALMMLGICRPPHFHLTRGEPPAVRGWQQSAYCCPQVEGYCCVVSADPSVGHLVVGFGTASPCYHQKSGLKLADPCWWVDRVGSCHCTSPQFHIHRRIWQESHSSDSQCLQSKTEIIAGELNRFSSVWNFQQSKIVITTGNQNSYLFLDLVEQWPS